MASAHYRYHIRKFYVAKNVRIEFVVCMLISLKNITFLPIRTLWFYKYKIFTNQGQKR